MKSIPKILTMPGNGVMTVHTAKDKKEDLLKAYYGTSQLPQAQALWLKSLKELSEDKPWLLGIPSDCGGGIQRGSNWGPLALRQELIDERKSFHDLGDVRVIPHLLHDKYLNAATIKKCQQSLYGRANQLPVSPLSITEVVLKEIYKKFPDARILGLGGDHSISLPLVDGWLASRRNLKAAGVLHFDAHTDLMDQRMGIDFCFGTWTYHILDRLASPGHLLQIGIRSSGKDQKHWKSNLGVEQIWAREALKNGVDKTYKKIIKHFKAKGIKEIYISFDIDALDEKYASATGTPEKGGLLPPDCAALIRMLKQEFQVTGADLMEVAPFVLPAGTSIRDHQSAMTVAGDMARVLLTALSRA